jgi:hypothetical protein
MATVWIALSRSLSSGAHSRDPLAPRNDGRNSTFSRRVASELCQGNALEKGERRESRVPAAPAASRAKVEKHTSVVTSDSDGINRLSPRDGFNSLLRALPGDRALLPPSFCGSSSTKLSASVGAPGPHDFSVRLDAVRRQHVRVHEAEVYVRDGGLMSYGPDQNEGFARVADLLDRILSRP